MEGIPFLKKSSLIHLLHSRKTSCNIFANILTSEFRSEIDLYELHSIGSLSYLCIRKMDASASLKGKDSVSNECTYISSKSAAIFNEHFIIKINGNTINPKSLARLHVVDCVFNFG